MTLAEDEPIERSVKLEVHFHHVLFALHVQGLQKGSKVFIFFISQRSNAQICKEGFKT